MSGPRMFNLVVSNVPGPQQTFYLAGVPLLEVFPAVPLNPRNQALIDRHRELRRRRAASACSPTATRCQTSTARPRASRRRPGRWSAAATSQAQG